MFYAVFIAIQNFMKWQYSL